MIGGMKKTVSRLALAAAVAGLATSASAADLGGSCCADLEERIAELEATTARKGNRVMSLRISGSISHRVFWHNSDADDAYRPDKVTIEDYDDGGDLRLSGSAKVSSDITVGFRMSFDPNDFGASDTSADSAPLDDLYLYVESKRLGSIFIGRVDQAMDGINAISLASIEDIQLDDAGADLFYGSGFLNAGDLDGTDAEGGTIRYVSPTVAGFVFSASYSNEADEQQSLPAGTAGSPFDNDEVWSVALRYAGEFNGIRVAAGIGYEQEQDDEISGNDIETLTGSFSVMHAPTGLFFNFAAGRGLSEDRQSSDETEITGYAWVFGMERKLIALGATTMYLNVDYIERDTIDGGVSASVDAINWGVGFVQKIDAAASDLRFQYLRKECVEAGCTDDADLIWSGLVVRF